MHRALLARARRHLVRCDPVIASVVRSVGPCRWGDGHPDLFSALVRAIVSQQLSVKAANTILGRVRRLLPAEDIVAAPLLAVPVADLRAAGLSARKAEYVRDLAARVVAGTLQLDRLADLSDEDVMRELTALRGIGRWTAEMILIFRLHRPDILPLDDIALQRAFQRA
jgi:DNA-3-methyladenine glycosylase II